MNNPIFDLNRNEMLLSISDHLAVDHKGNMHIKIGNNMAMDLTTGTAHFTTSWHGAAEPEQTERQPLFKNN